MAKKRPPAVMPEPVRPLVDAHTHLYSTARKMIAKEYQGQAIDVQAVLEDRYLEYVDRIVERAAAVGVEQICTIGDGIVETRAAVQAADHHPNVYAAVAIHPTLAHTLTAEVRAELRDLARHPKCVAIGETGLDTYWIGKDEHTPSLEVQEAAFRWHIDLACELDKPLMIHNREADQELLDVLADAPQPPAVIMHCFSSPLAIAKQCVERGYVLSFAGNATFRANDYLREAVALAGASNVLIETDAPYMTPEPNRGRQNEPAYVGHTARVLAEALGMPTAEFAALTAENARRVFRIGE